MQEQEVKEREEGEDPKASNAQEDTTQPATEEPQKTADTEKRPSKKKRMLFVFGAIAICLCVGLLIHNMVNKAPDTTHLDGWVSYTSTDGVVTFSVPGEVKTATDALDFVTYEEAQSDSDLCSILFTKYGNMIKDGATQAEREDAQEQLISFYAAGFGAEIVDETTMEVDGVPCKQTQIVYQDLTGAFCVFAIERDIYCVAIFMNVENETGPIDPFFDSMHIMPQGVEQ